MATLFLSHTSIDKPFVEKLAADLNRLGVQVWYDKYEIKVGESIFWRVEEGLRSSELFGIVLSPEALESEWVKSELSSAWAKKMGTKKNSILPLLYRSCTLPTLLQSIKYADFRNDYQQGLSDLAQVFGIKNITIPGADNWRSFVKVKDSNWKSFRESEFQELITALCKITREMNFSIWVSGKAKPFSFAISTSSSKGKLAFCIRMDPKQNYRYMCAENGSYNTIRVPISDFILYVGTTVNEVSEYVYSKLDDYVSRFGYPDEERIEFTERLDKYRGENARLLYLDMQKKTNWNQEP